MAVSKEKLDEDKYDTHIEKQLTKFANSCNTKAGPGVTIIIECRYATCLQNVSNFVP